MLRCSVAEPTTPETQQQHRQLMAFGAQLAVALEDGHLTAVHHSRASGGSAGGADRLGYRGASLHQAQDLGVKEVDLGAQRSEVGDGVVVAAGLTAVGRGAVALVACCDISVISRFCPGPAFPGSNNAPGPWTPGRRGGLCVSVTPSRAPEPVPVKKAMRTHHDTKSATLRALPSTSCGVGPRAVQARKNAACGARSKTVRCTL